MLEIEQIKTGLKDLTGTIAALGVIFIVSPLMALAFAQIPLQTGILIGIFLVAVMPTTLSSGVVMTGAAGGNTAHALFITILANTIAVFSVPVTLSLLLSFKGGSTTVMIDRWHIMAKLFSIVLLPLCGGMVIKYFAGRFCIRLAPMLQVFNQCLILVIVWMGISQARQAIFDGGKLIGGIILLSFLFHGALLAAAGGIARIFKIGRGRTGESDIYGGPENAALIDYFAGRSFSTIRAGVGFLCGASHRAPDNGWLSGGENEGLAIFHPSGNNPKPPRFDIRESDSEKIWSARGWDP